LPLRDILVEPLDELGTAGEAIEGATIAVLAMSGPMLILGADPTLIWALVNLMQMLFYLLFLNVDYPNNLKAFLEIFSIGRVEFLPNPLSPLS